MNIKLFELTAEIDRHASSLTGASSSSFSSSSSVAASSSSSSLKKSCGIKRTKVYVPGPLSTKNKRRKKYLISSSSSSRSTTVYLLPSPSYSSETSPAPETVAPPSTPVVVLSPLQKTLKELQAKIEEVEKSRSALLEQHTPLFAKK